MRLYRYVGPKRIADRVGCGPAGFAVHSKDDVRAWCANTRQSSKMGYIVATFVVNTKGILMIADRHSEHVVCADGEPVQTAGEITFDIGREVEVVAISNQSTGYCPEPESWPAVAEALSRAGLEAPSHFSPCCVFRCCLACGNLTLVKDDLFECGMCGAALPADYNVQ